MLRQGLFLYVHIISPQGPADRPTILGYRGYMANEYRDLAVAILVANSGIWVRTWAKKARQHSYQRARTMRGNGVKEKHNFC
jgi:hypothetical protein